MDELISKRQAIDALRGYLVGKRCPDDGTLTCRLIENEVSNKLPSAQLGTDLAEVGIDLATKRTVKGFPIDADLLMLKAEEEYGFRARDRLYELIRTMPKYELPPVQPKRETTTLRIGRTRNSVTMWYECAECGEPVDQEDAFCRRCGRGIIHE